MGGIATSHSVIAMYIHFLILGKITVPTKRKWLYYQQHMTSMSSFPGNKFAASSCDWMPCFDSYNEIILTSSSANELCPVIVDTLSCVDQVTGCGIFEPALEENKRDLLDKSTEYNCTIPESTPDPVPTPNTTVLCPSKLLQLPLVPIQNLSTADIVSDQEPSLCPQFDSSNEPATRHCSVYTYSHILAFNKHDIQGFTLPGSFYILNYNRGVKIEIFTAVRDIESPHSLSVQKVRLFISDLYRNTFLTCL